MDRECKSCGKSIDEDLVLCPFCKNLPSEETTPDLKTEHIKEIAKQVKKEIRNSVLLWVGILSIIFGIGFWQAYKAATEKIRDLLIQQVSEEFREPKIKKTVQDVAQNQAAKLLKDEINPEQKKITNQITDFKTYLDETESQFREEYLQLSKEVTFLRKRNMLLRLADEAIAKGTVSSLKKLKSYTKPDSETGMREMALSEILRVKTYYATMTRIKNFSIKAVDMIGPVRVDDTIPTDNLISKLKNAPDWRVQAKAAQLLSDRREKRVPQALLESVCKNPRLDVVKLALTSFQAVTGFKSKDVFDCEAATNWWKENEQQVTGKLK